MNDPTPKSPVPDQKGYNHFLLAIAIGIIVGTLLPLLLEYFGIIDFVKNWP